jgi:hypothetical protein
MHIMPQVNHPSQDPYPPARPGNHQSFHNKLLTDEYILKRRGGSRTIIPSLPIMWNVCSANCAQYGHFPLQSMYFSEFQKLNFWQMRYESTTTRELVPSREGGIAAEGGDVGKKKIYGQTDGGTDGWTTANMCLFRLFALHSPRYWLSNFYVTWDCCHT